MPLLICRNEYSDYSTNIQLKDQQFKLNNCLWILSRLEIKLTDVILPIKSDIEIRLWCISQPDAHQRILVHRLGIQIPKRMQ